EWCESGQQGPWHTVVPFHKRMRYITALNRVSEQNSCRWCPVASGVGLCERIACNQRISQNRRTNPGILVIVVPLLVLVFDLRNKFPEQIILVDLSMMSVHLNPHLGKTTNWM